MTKYYARDEISVIRRELDKSGDFHALPIGFVFLSVLDTNPADLLGYGTWEAFAEGRMLVGHDGADTDFDTAEETGGAKTKAISAHAGTAVANHDHHHHTFTAQSSAATPDLVAADTSGAGVAASGNTGDESVVLTHTVTQPNNHADLNVMPPYVVVYMWKRTA